MPYRFVRLCDIDTSKTPDELIEESQAQETQALGGNDDYDGLFGVLDGDLRVVVTGMNVGRLVEKFFPKWDGSGMSYRVDDMCTVKSEKRCYDAEHVNTGECERFQIGLARMTLTEGVVHDLRVVGQELRCVNSY